jgi:hypothetical protein
VRRWRFGPSSLEANDNSADPPRTGRFARPPPPIAIAKRAQALRRGLIYRFLGFATFREKKHRRNPECSYSKFCSFGGKNTESEWNSRIPVGISPEFAT